MIKRFVMFSILNLIYSTSFSQHFEIGIGFGNSISNIDFNHSSQITTVDDKEYQGYNNSNFYINLNAPLSKRWLYIKSEIGFLKINSFYSLRYSYDEGLGVKNGFDITYLTNEKIYFSVSPEYRKKFSLITLKISGGPIITSDISNVMSTTNTILLAKSNPLGFKLESGILYKRKRIGVDLNVGYAKIGQSVLQNDWHPKISYNLLFANIGVVYSLPIVRLNSDEENH